jgi:hypothetical protein
MYRLRYVVLIAMALVAALAKAALGGAASLAIGGLMLSNRNETFFKNAD